MIFTSIQLSGSVSLGLQKTLNFTLFYGLTVPLPAGTNMSLNFHIHMSWITRLQVRDSVDTTTSKALH